MCEMQKKGRRTQGRSENPDQGVQMNSTWPDAPFRGHGSKVLRLGTRTFRFRLAVLKKQS